MKFLKLLCYTAVLVACLSTTGRAVYADDEIPPEPRYGERPPRMWYYPQPPLKKGDRSEDCDIDLNQPQYILVKLFPPRHESQPLRSNKDATPCEKAIDRKRWKMYDNWLHDYHVRLNAYNEKYIIPRDLRREQERLEREYWEKQRRERLQNGKP